MGRYQSLGEGHYSWSTSSVHPLWAFHGRARQRVQKHHRGSLKGPNKSHSSRNCLSMDCHSRTRHFWILQEAFSFLPLFSSSLPSPFSLLLLSFSSPLLSSSSFPLPSSFLLPSPSFPPLLPFSSPLPLSSSLPPLSFSLPLPFSSLLPPLSYLPLRSQSQCCHHFGVFDDGGAYENVMVYVLQNQAMQRAL